MGIFNWGKKKQPAYKPPKVPLSGNFTVGLGAIEIRYTNFVGEHRTFTGDYRSAYIRGRHVVIRVIPTGKRISLNLEKIENRAEVFNLYWPRKSQWLQVVWTDSSLSWEDQGNRLSATDFTVALA